MVAAKRWATEIGAEPLIVRSKINREESHAFYAALGYEFTKTQYVYQKLLPVVHSVPNVCCATPATIPCTTR